MLARFQHRRCRVSSHQRRHATRRLLISAPGIGARLASRLGSPPYAERGSVYWEQRRQLGGSACAKRALGQLAAISIAEEWCWACRPGAPRAPKAVAPAATAAVQVAAAGEAWATHLVKAIYSERGRAATGAETMVCNRCSHLPEKDRGTKWAVPLNGFTKAKAHLALFCTGLQPDSNEQDAQLRQTLLLTLSDSQLTTKKAKKHREAALKRDEEMELARLAMLGDTNLVAIHSAFGSGADPLRFKQYTLKLLAVSREATPET
eukprot:jgi/Tetstr1/434360/TSEL_023464.t1